MFSVMILTARDGTKLTGAAGNSPPDFLAHQNDEESLPRLEQDRHAQIASANRSLVHLGAVRVIGNADDDLLIGGLTDFDSNNVALAAILAEWTSTRSYSERIANLTGDSNAPTFASRLNADSFLKTDGPRRTIFDDEAADRRQGGDYGL